MQINRSSWIVKYARRWDNYPFEYDDTTDTDVTDSCTLTRAVVSNFFKDSIVAILGIVLLALLGDLFAWVLAMISTMTFIDPQIAASVA